MYYLCQRWEREGKEIKILIREEGRNNGDNSKEMK